MLISVKQSLIVAIAISFSVMIAGSATGGSLSALPPDAELKKWIVGSWRIDLPATSFASPHGYEVYSENGTFKHFESVKEGSAPEKLLAKLTGTWTVEDGFLVSRVTAANVSTTNGRLYRERIESANPDSFVLLEQGGSRTRRRAPLPAGLISGTNEVPKVFTIEEAAQVLRYAVKPQYSREAQRTRATGSGLFELRFDYETGRLKAIDIVRSTGSRLLDHDAINGLKEWKAKPRSVRVMRIPITFTFAR